MGLSFVSRRALSVGAVAVAGVLGLSACGGGSTTSASPSDGASSGAPAAATGPKLVTPGKLTTCTNLPYEPFEFKEGDKTVGFDVDIVDLAAKKLGVTQEIVDIDVRGHQERRGPTAGKCDVAAAGMTITAERKANIDFSVPYFDATQALLVPRRAMTAKTLEELKAQKLKLGVQAATTGEDYVKKAGLDPKVVSTGPRRGAARPATGQVDVIVQDLPVWSDWHQEAGHRRQVRAGRQPRHRRAVRHRPEEGRRPDPAQGHQRRHHDGQVRRHVRRDLHEVDRREARRARLIHGRSVDDG